MGGDMPLILDEMARVADLEIHGFQGGVVITIQRIRPTAADGNEFPTDLVGQSVGVIGVYPRDASTSPFYLNAKQAFEYIKNPGNQTVDVYGLPYGHHVVCAGNPRSELHIMQDETGLRLSIGCFKLKDLTRWVASVYRDYPEFFT